MLEAIASSQLEGAVTIRALAKELLRTQRAPVDRSEQMILNTFRALQRLRDLETAELSPALVVELHGLVTEGAEARKQEPLETLSPRLEALCAFANGKDSLGFIHPLIRGFLLHFWLAHDHPFAEGNGRTARALFYWLLRRHGYQLFEFISLSEILLQAPAGYAASFLLAETDDNDLTHFILHQAGILRKALEALQARLADKERELGAAAEIVRGLGDLNIRQQALLTHALRAPGCTYTIAAPQNSHGVTHQTARDDLFALEKRGLLRVGKQGRSFVFQASTDLGKKLERTQDERRPGDSNTGEDRILILGGSL